MHPGTRAAALSAVGLCTSLVLVPPATASASGPPPEGTVAFSVGAARGEVGRLDGADRSMALHHDVPSVVTAATAPIPVGDGVNAIGVSWSGAVPHGVVQWRFRPQGGAAGAWSELPTGAHGPDADTAEARSARRASEPVLTTDPGSVELRIIGDAAPPSTVVATVDAADAPHPSAKRSASVADVRLPAPAPTTASDAARAAASGSTPSISTRAAWGADESLRKGNPSYGAVKGEVVHHTVNANTYAAADVPALIRSIYEYHVLRNGWNDIGYNFLIDRFGRTWEGRYGGVNRPVVGAHSPGVNSWSTGAATIGNFSSSGTTVPAAVTTAYRNLFTWKARLHQMEPDWKVNLGGTPQRSISGHRDNVATECPGAALYSKIPAITAATSAATPNSPALTVRRDADNDGGNDVLTVDGQGRLALVHADDAGVLQSPDVKTTLNPTGFDMLRVAGDWGGDGAVDVIGRLKSNGNLYLWSGDGAGGFRAPVRIGVGWSGMRLMTTVGDLTGDGRPDLIASAASDSLLRVYPGNGKGGFLTARVIGTGWNTIRSIVGVGDWDRDGDADVLGITTAGTPNIYRNLGTGQLTNGPKLNFTAPAPAVVTAIGDVTFDTLNDLVVKDATGRVRVAASPTDTSVVRWVDQSASTVATWRGLQPSEG